MSIAEPDPVDAEFLALPPLQVDVKATVSPAPLDPPAHASLLVCSNRHGFLVHGTNDGLGFVRTEPLLTAVRNAEPGTRVRPPAGSAASVPLAAGPATHVALAGNELTVFAASAGGALVAFSAASLAASIDASPATPLESTTVPGGDVRALKANPDPNSAQIAVLSSDGAVRFVDFASNAFKVGNPVPIEGITDIDWFPRGKQLACGTSSNKVIQITPAGQIKREYGPPPDIAGDHVQKLRWIEERVFLVIYADTPPPDDDVPQTDAFVLRRGDKDAVEYTKLADPALPFRLERPSHHHIATIEGWGDKAKRIVFVANTTAAEAGVIGCSEDGWRNWSLADNSLISMPLDEEDRDTWPLGLAVDLTSTVTLPPATPDDPPVPPMPILLILNNLGDLLAHHCIMSSVSGPFPSMVEKIQQIPADAKSAPAAAPGPSPAVAPAPAAAKSLFGAVPSGSASASKPLFGSEPSKPLSTGFTFGAPASDSKPLFGAEPSKPLFGAEPSKLTPSSTGFTFGAPSGDSKPAFGAEPSKPLFGTGPSKQPSTTSLFGAAASGSKPLFGAEPSKPLFGSEPSKPPPTGFAFGAAASDDKPSAGVSDDAKKRPDGKGPVPAPATASASAASSIRRKPSAFSVTESAPPQPVVAKQPVAAASVSKPTAVTAAASDKVSSSSGSASPAQAGSASAASARSSKATRAPAAAAPPAPAPEPKEPKIELLVSKFDDLYLGLESDFEAFKKYSATVTSTLEDARRPNPNAENLPLKSLALGDLPRVMSAARDTIVRIEHAGKLCSALRSARDELLASMKELAVKNKESKSRLDFLLKRDPDWLAPPGTLGPEAADMRVRLFAKRDRVEEMIDSIKRALELLENNIDQHSSSRRERLKTSDWQSICTTVTQLTKSGLAASHRLDRLIIEMQAAKQAHKSAASTAAGRQHLRRPTAQASGSVSSTHTSPTAFGSSSARKVARTPRGPFGLPDDESFADESVLYPTVPLLADKEAAEKLSQQKAARAKLKQILVRADRVVPINTTATTSQMPKELLRRQLPPRPARPPPVPVSIGAPHATPTLQPPAPARPDAPEALTPIAIASVVVPLAATAPTFGNAPEKTEPASALQFSTSKVAIAPSAPFGSAAKSGEPKPATMFSFTAAGAAAQSDKPSAATAFAFPVPAATAAPLAFGSASKPDDMPAFVFGSAPSDAKPTPLFQVPPSDKPAFLFTATASPSNAVQPAAVESADKDLKSKDKENRSDSGSEGGNYDEYNEDDYEEIHGPEDDEKEYDDFLAENPQMAAASAAAAKAESAPPPPPPPPGEIPGAATANAAPTPQAKQPSATSFTFAAAPQPFSFVAPATKPSTPDAKPGATASPGSGTKTHSPFGASSSIFNQPPAFPLSGDSAPPPAVSPSGLFANMSTPLPKTMPTTFGSGGSPSPLGTGFSFGAKPAGDQLAFASKIPVVGARKADAGGSGGDAEQPIAARLPDFSAIKSPEVSGAGVKLSPAPAPSPQRAAESASPTPAPASPPKMSYSAVAKQPTAAPTAPIVAVATASVHKDDHEQDDYDDADEEGEDAEAQESAADADADQEGEGDVANAEDEEEVVESESEDEEEESQVEDEDDELQVEDPDDEAPAEDADNEAQVEDAEREEAADGDASDQSFEGHNEDDDAPPTDQTPTQGSHVQLVAEREPRPAAIDVHEEASTVGDDESRANYTHSDSSWLHSSTRAREVQQAGAIGGPDDSAPVGVPEELTESEINAGGEPQAPSSFNMGSAFGSFEIVDKSAPGGRPETRMADTDADPQASAVPQGLESLSGIDFGLGSSAPKKSVNPMFAVAAGAAAAPPARPSEGGFGASAFGGSAFGKPSEPGSGPTSFGSFVKKDDAKPAFGQPSFGQPATSTPAFGQSSFGKPAPASTPAAPAFGQSGFGQAAAPAFGQSACGQAASSAAPVFGQSGFGQSSTAAPSFGQATFGQPSFGQPSFGQPSFGQSSFGQPSVSGTAAGATPGSEGVAFGKSSFGAAAGAAPAFGSFPNVQGTSSFDSSSFAGGNAPTSFAATASGFGSGGFGAFAQRAEGQPTGFGAVSAGGASVFGGGGAIGGASGSTFGSSSFDKSKTKDSSAFKNFRG
ncbi:hypothetical protein HK105_205416 [Polyrhizophydium stewartii]|uniref:Nucleoporin Nup159/Nup146 N-terminal domain-containing protein n=1 Tax=Polyrhizophydium stewartii TaxID=2732419 RepID=A0ABR4N6E6_9FUNG